MRIEARYFTWNYIRTFEFVLGRNEKHKVRICDNIGGPLKLFVDGVEKLRVQMFPRAKGEVPSLIIGDEEKHELQVRKYYWLLGWCDLEIVLDGRAIIGLGAVGNTRFYWAFVVSFFGFLFAGTLWQQCLHRGYLNGCKLQGAASDCLMILCAVFYVFYSIDRAEFLSKL